jgi:hypothetical protein
MSLILAQQQSSLVKPKAVNNIQFDIAGLLESLLGEDSDEEG